MTTITFERSGGVIGNEINLNLNVDTLSEDNAKRLLNLVENADFFKIPRIWGWHPPLMNFNTISRWITVMKIIAFALQIPLCPSHCPHWFEN